MQFPRGLPSGERNGTEQRFRVGVRHHYLGTGCGLAFQWIPKQDVILLCAERELRETSH
jgi:hypothetical protein